MKGKKVYIVEGGWNYEGESKDSMRVFRNEEDAKAYEEEISYSGFDYVLISERVVS